MKHSLKLRLIICTVLFFNCGLLMPHPKKVRLNAIKLLSYSKSNWDSNGSCSAIYSTLTIDTSANLGIWNGYDYSIKIADTVSVFSFDSTNTDLPKTIDFDGGVVSIFKKNEILFFGKNDLIAQFQFSSVTQHSGDTLINNDNDLKIAVYYSFVDSKN